MRYHSPKRRRSTADLNVTRPLVGRRSDGICDRCGWSLPIGDDGSPEFEFHHRQKRSQGGGDGPENGLALCSTCHRLAHAQVAWSVENGWIVERGKDPARTPVMIAGRMCWLTAKGTAEPIDGCITCGSGDCGPERCAFVGVE